MSLAHKKVLARCVLATALPVSSSPRCLTPSQFVDLCTAHHRIAPKDRLSRAEALEFLLALEAAGDVVITAEPPHTVFLASEAFFKEVQKQLAGPIPASSTVLRPIGLKKPTLPFLSSAVIARTTYWSRLALLGSLQLAVLGYLTFQVSSWDVMEPICYFLSSLWGLSWMRQGIRRTTPTCFTHVSSGPPPTSFHAMIEQESLLSVSGEAEEDAFGLAHSLNTSQSAKAGTLGNGAGAV